MDSKVIWKQDLSFTGSATSGFELPLGTDPAVGGANDGFRPLELLAVGLAGCTAMDVISILRKKQQAVSAFEVRVHADQATEHPHVFTRAVITYLVTGPAVDEAALVRAIQLSEEKYCAAKAMLAKAVPLELRYEIYQPGEKGQPELVRQAEYKPQPV